MKNEKLKFGGDEAIRVKKQLDAITLLTITDTAELKKKIKAFGELLNLYGEGKGSKFTILGNRIEVNDNKDNFINSKQKFAELVNSTLE